MRLRCVRSFEAAAVHLGNLDSLIGKQWELQGESDSGLREAEGLICASLETATDLGNRCIRVRAHFVTETDCLEQAAAVWQRTNQVLPNGKEFASDGAAALSELQRIVRSGGPSEKLEEHVLLLKEDFDDAVTAWRDARLSFEKAKVDLDVRGSSSHLRYIGDQLDQGDRVLEEARPALTLLRTQLATLREDSSQWAGVLTELGDKLHSVRERLSASRHQFHLADLAFAAFQIQLADDHQEGVPAGENGQVVGGLSTTKFKEGSWETKPFQNLVPYVPQTPPFRDRRMPDPTVSGENPADAADLMARLALTTARLSYLASLLDDGTMTVQSALEKVEEVGEETAKIQGELAELSQDVISHRQSIDGHRRALAAGLGALVPLQKRFDAEEDSLRTVVANGAKMVAKFAELLEP